ncbi:hypothetical protein NDGK_02804 [Clostridiales bacterium CHKCI001]|nr:hypothetical protein NDGK_02804 [Clostridiales bacterium CHKCI001]
MLHIIFLILKIIGIIIGLIVLLLLLLLFVPIRYKGDLDYFDNGNGWVKIYWLLHLISVKLIIEQNHPQLAIKVLGIPLGSRKKKKENEQFDFEMETEIPPNQAEPAKLPATVEEEVEIQHTDETNSKIEQSSENEETEIFTEQEETSEQVEDTTETVSFWKKGIRAIQAFWNRIVSFPSKLRTIWKKLKATVLTIWKKLTSSKQKLVEVKEILLEENSRMVYVFLKVRLVRIIRHIRPKKFQLYLHYGFEDPAFTGEITGIMAIFMGWYENTISLEPDFQQTVLEGSLKFRGSVQIAVLLWEAIRVVFHKSFRVMIKKLMGKIKE